jgi:stage II sporulation protein D
MQKTKQLLVLQFLMLIFVIFVMLKTEASLHPNELVRVRLEKSDRQFVFTAEALQLQGKASWQFASIPKRSNYSITRKGLLWTLQRAAPQKPEFFTGKVLWLEAQRIERQEKLWPNRLLLIPKGEDQFDVIGVVPLESYLVGVVSGEMPASWPIEALKAQAVAARSYTMAVLRERRHREFHVESSILDQVFKAMTLSEWQSPNMKRVIRAVRETEGKVVVDIKSRPLKTYYHSHCGGETVDSRSVWGQKDFSQGVLDSACVNNRSGAWTVSFELPELAEKVVAQYPQFQSQILTSVQPEKVGLLKRANRVVLRWSGGKSLWLNGNEFRRLVGYEKLLSTNFELIPSGNTLIFRGFGRGHGVGLCQFGTKALAEQKKSYKEIVSHYFPLGKLHSLKLSEASSLSLTQTF